MLSTDGDRYKVSMYGFDDEDKPKDAPKKVAFCVPIVRRPYPGFISALEQTIPLIKSAGWDEAVVQEVNNPYISGARAKMLRKDLDHGADVNIRNAIGQTPLMIAVRALLKRNVELLLERGADPNTKSNAGWTPLGVAKDMGAKEISELLRKYGAKD